MDEKLQLAFDNIGRVVRNARMTGDEHDQLKYNLMSIHAALQPKPDKDEDKE